LNRRQFLRIVPAVAVTSALRSSRTQAETKLTSARLPRWRGFNLLEKYTDDKNAPFREEDFAWIAAWGFDFVRLPLSYRCWSDARDWRQLREPVLREIDHAVAWGRRYHVHVNLNFHRAPGYCVNPPPEPMDLWKDANALDACGFHWAHFAERYRGIPSADLSFNLLNEPAKVAEAVYGRVVRRLVEAVRGHDPDRLILADGLNWATRPVPSLVELGIAQSTHMYDPLPLTHYQANWISGSNQWPTPTWPLTDSGKQHWDKDTIGRRRIEPWKALERRGVGVHVGEWGVFHRTPHTVALAWMKDNLALWKEAGWGWALWNFRGSFGVLDSGREDVAYETFHGHQFDRQMLELLQAG
jgi:endoglucanase